MDALSVIYSISSFSFQTNCTHSEPWLIDRTVEPRTHSKTTKVLKPSQHKAEQPLSDFAKESSVEAAITALAFQSVETSAKKAKSDEDATRRIKLSTSELAYSKWRFSICLPWARSWLKSSLHTEKMHRVPDVLEKIFDNTFFLPHTIFSSF